MLEKVKAARAAELEAEAAGAEAALLKAEEEAAADEAAASNEAAVLEAELKAAGLDAEAEEIHRLREALDGGKMTGVELEQASKDAHALAERLRGMDGVDSAQHMAGEADELGNKLSVAAKAKLHAEVLELQKEAAEDLKEVAAAGYKLADELRAAGKDKEAREVERITLLCEDVAAGKLEGDALDKAIDDTKKAIEELRAAGLEDEAKALEAMLEKMEAAQAAQKAADASESELKVMIMVEGGGDDDEEELDEMIDEVKSKAAKLRASGRIAEAEEEEMPASLEEAHRMIRSLRAQLGNGV